MYPMAVESRIRELAFSLAAQLRERIQARHAEMEQDDASHLVLYRALGVLDAEGRQIDLYQNSGRFLYKYAATLLEAAVLICFQTQYPEARSVKIPNSQSNSPRTFEIDCLVGNDAIEIKWRDATTDGDHIAKEAARVRTIAAAGYHPIRLMFYHPNRRQAQQIQLRIAKLYQEIGGVYYAGAAAWDYLKERTGVDLQQILQGIADEQGP